MEGLISEFYGKSIVVKVHLYLFLNREKMKIKQAFYFSTFQLSKNA